ncbi:MAG TPA: hypothetical protein VN031_02750, partial [Candidatus Microsaccharimonas sp.]|nr:hypothetical protein [Candidatus Microsaccharimonas sp.]
WNISSQTFPTARSSFGPGAVYNGKFYIVGGCTGSGTCGSTASADVEIGGPQSIPRVAHYSSIVDLKSTANGSVGGDPQITRFALGFTPASASSAVNVCWQGATTAAPSNNNAFGSTTCASALTSLNRTVWSSYGRYAFAYVTLDDSQSATFPDTNQTSLTEIDTYFHASPARRLRMGQTFTDMGQQGGRNNQLDTEGP